MKNLINEYQNKISMIDKTILRHEKTIRKTRNDSGKVLENEDARSCHKLLSSKRQTLVQVIKDIEGSDTLVILDYLVDLNKEHGTDSSGRRILRVEQSVFDKMKDITESIK